MIVLLTYGLSCPPLAILILFSIWIKYFCSRIILNRFLDYRWNLFREVYGEKWNNSELILHQLFLQDPIIKLLDSSLESVSMTFERAWPVILFSATVFHSLICWDISTDHLKWNVTIFIPTGMIFFFLLLCFILYHYHLGFIATWRMKLYKNKIKNELSSQNTSILSEIESSSRSKGFSSEIHGIIESKSVVRDESSFVSI